MEKRLLISAAFFLAQSVEKSAGLLHYLLPITTSAKRAKNISKCEKNKKYFVNSKKIILSAPN
jgi:hypothetical protein